MAEKNAAWHGGMEPLHRGQQVAMQKIHLKVCELGGTRSVLRSHRDGALAVRHLPGGFSICKRLRFCLKCIGDPGVGE